VSSENQAIFLNAIPLLILGLLYLLAAAALAPSLVRERRNVRELELSLALVFPAGGIAAVVFGLLVLDTREPVGERAWAILAVVGVALLPLVALAARWSQRIHLLTGAQRARAAEELSSERELQRRSVNTFTTALARTTTAEEVGRLLVDGVCELLDVDFGALALVDGTDASGLVAVRDGEELEWWHGLRLDLERDPSAIASAAF
jgi:hypothetical protein